MSDPAIRVAIVVFDGCMTSAVTGLLDALQIANLWGAAFIATTIGAGGAVTGSSGFSIPTSPLDDAPYDIAIVPPIMAPIPDTLAAGAAIVAWLRRRATTDTVIASVCAGAFFLAEAGLLAGRRATTNPMFADAFRRRFGDVELACNERLVDEGRVLCAGSTTAFLDLAVYLIDRFVGHAIAVATAKSLCIDMVHRSQQPFFLYVAPKDHGDAGVLELQTWLEGHYSGPIEAAQLARQGAMSQRTLNRRFRSATGLSPIEYLHRLRIEGAKRLLETSALSVDEITARVGYADARSFSRLFRTSAGLTPREYRTRFGPQRL